ncbi:MAG: TrkA family potassium uptake protein [Elusimicrobiota bacterium]
MAKKQKNYVVIGLGSFGANISRALTKLGCQVLGIDVNEDNVKNIANEINQAVQADAADQKTLNELGITDFETVIVSIGENVEASIFITLLLKEMGVRNLIVRGVNPMHAQLLSKVGADRIVFPEKEMAERLAESLVSPNIIEQIELSPEYNITEILLPQMLKGKTIKEADIRARFNLHVIGLRRKMPVVLEDGETDFKEDLIIAPQPDSELMAGDILIILGRDEDMNKFKHL